MEERRNTVKQYSQNSKRRRLPRALEVLFALWALIVFCTATAMAQTGFSGLRGNVTDNSGAIVQGAQVVLTQPATGEKVRTAVSDQGGNFEFPNLTPGTYQVTSERAGFKAFVANDVVLDAGQVRRLDIRLAVGSTNETIEVHAGAALINTEGGSITGTFDKAKVADAPVIDSYPEPNALILTLPGVQGAGWDLKISGQDSSQQSMQVDGVANDRSGEQSNNMHFFDEATVATVNAPADSSRVVAYNLTSKRGQNDFHGMVYYEHFNAGLNAKAHPQSKRSPYIEHDWQAELSGPIWRNHTFFYASWFEQRVPLGSYNVATVPTQAMWNGNFAGFAPIIDPQTGKPFPNNQIPANRISPVSEAVKQYYPTPNIGDPNVFQSNNFGWQHPFSSSNYLGDWPFVRIDHNISSKNSIYGRWLQRKTPFVLPGSLPSTLWTRLRDNRQSAVADTHVFSPTVVNVLRFGYSTDWLEDGAPEAGRHPLDGGDVIKAIGLQGVNPSHYNQAGTPAISINGISRFSTVTGGVKNDDRTYSLEDSVTWQKGRHVMKFGGDGTLFRFHSGVVPDYGSFTFNGGFTGGAPGSSFADFLLGLPRTSKRSDPFVNRRVNNTELGFYGMDTFKVTSKLTLEYGLRWDYYGLPRYQDGLMYNFDLGTGTVLVPQDKLSLVNPRYPSNIKIAPGQVVPNASLANFRPRVSAAYLLRPGFVVRGGYGQFTQRFSRWYSDLASNQGPGPFAHLAESYTNQMVSGQPLFSFPNPFPDPSLAKPAPSQQVLALPKNWDNGVIHQFNLSIEKQIANTGVRASYIGSRSLGQNFISSSNTGQWLNVNIAPPSQQAYDNSRLPYPNMAGVYDYRSDGQAKYDSLQLEASRRQGWATFDAHYTWASSFNNEFNTDDTAHPTKAWARDSGLRRNLLAVTSVLKLPFGRGAQHLSSAPRFVDAVVGGWTAETISYFGSGDYMTPYFYGYDVANNNYNSYLPDVIPGAHPDLSPSERSEKRFFNTAVYHRDAASGAFIYDHTGAFAIPGCSTTDPLCLNSSPANVGRLGNARVSSILGPRLDVNHLSLAKTIPTGERVRTTFTTAITDIFNHPLFYHPDTYINAPDAGQLVWARADTDPEEAGHRQIAFKLRVEF